MISPSDFCIKNLRLQKKVAENMHCIFLVYLFSDIKMLEYNIKKIHYFFVVDSSMCLTEQVGRA